MWAQIDYNNDKKEYKGYIDKAIASTMKAYSFFALPIFLYDLGCFWEMRGELDNAKENFRKFLTLQKDFKPTQVQGTFLKESDILGAVKYASDKLH